MRVYLKDGDHADIFGGDTYEEVEELLSVVSDKLGEDIASEIVGCIEHMLEEAKQRGYEDCLWEHEEADIDMLQ